LKIFPNNQFKHFANTLYLIRSVQYHASTFKTITLSFDVINFQIISKLENSKYT